MTPDLSPEAWAQIRHDYEHTGRPIPEICAEHGISAGTLRDRMRRWGWTRRRQPVPANGPAAAPAPAPIRYRPLAGAGNAESFGAIAPEGAAEENPLAALVPHLRDAAARLVPAIEAAVASLAAQPLAPAERTRAVRALEAMTQSVRQLNGLLRESLRDSYDDMPEDLDAFRRELARRIEAFVASRTGKDAETAPQET